MSKRNKIIYWVTTIWLALGMFSTGMVQLTQAKDGPGGAVSMAHLGYPPYLSILLGIYKLLGVIVVLVPGFPLLKEWAYAGFFFIMSGAVFSHIASGYAIQEIFPALLLLLLTVISWYIRPANKRIMKTKLYASEPKS
ncbi:DoxX family protein [Parafilimonas sp.]|uniref:DoxX family protein n=1 Tax=Parafilimonas sp. TaxID=1969739 RepID=UPI0039E227D0